MVGIHDAQGTAGDKDDDDDNDDDGDEISVWASDCLCNVEEESSSSLFIPSMVMELDVVLDVFAE